VQAYFCHIPNGDNIEDRELFTFAGIYTSDSEGSYYTSIITIDANPFFAEIHNQKKRMPLVLDKKYESDWLEEGQSEKIIKDLLMVLLLKNFMLTL
jgi:putative SOS response-associated peptidase YedK